MAVAMDLRFTVGETNDPLSIDTEELPEGIGVHISGEVDLGNADRLKGAIQPAVDNSRNVILDVRHLTYIDSSGLYMALAKTAGAHPDVASLYARFLQTIVLPHAAAWSWAITLGEIAVGLGLILGLFTGIAAFCGGLMNANYLLAGTVSTNPILFILATWLVLAWRVAGYYGLDYWVLPAVGVPGWPGRLLQHRRTAST